MPDKSLFHRTLAYLRVVLAFDVTTEEVDKRVERIAFNVPRELRKSPAPAAS